MKPLILFSSLITLICSTALLFSLIFIAPTISEWALNAYPEDYDSITLLFATLGRGHWFYAIVFAPLIALITIGITRSQTSKLAQSGKLATFTSLFAILLLALVIWHSGAVYSASSTGKKNYQLHAGFLKASLEQAAILAEAEGRTKIAEERIKRLNLGGTDLVPVKEVTSQSKRHQKAKVLVLTGALKLAETPAAEKRILATLALFETDFLANQHRLKQRKLILARIQGHNETKLETYEEALTWVKKQSGPEWTPLPLYEIYDNFPLIGRSKRE